ncbi:MAG: hypothetical protein A3I17_03920 [Candidatus Rokubacteria bacterium RIFCSPLOWO2_02_FULL_72_37]|nr:MAG: hypothetical protein A3I17_03920 [Candidatus Rokubacteria bacterium RIFCSPLOWO2_02_FULL_72_37]
MPQRLLVLNVLLGGVSLLGVAYIVQQLALAPASPAPRGPRPAPSPAAAAAAPGAAPAGPGAGAYTTIASRNLFSPTRSEAPGAAAGAVPAGLAKPILYGVVLRDGAPIAYLQDPATKRTASYRIGDQIAGGTVKTIDADQVVLSSPAGQVSVRLRDPSKPRAPVQPVAQPGAPGRPAQPTVVAPGAVTPPAIPPRVGAPPVFPPQGLPGQPGSLLAPGMRPSPSFGRSLSVPRATDVPQK